MSDLVVKRNGELVVNSNAEQVIEGFIRGLIENGVVPDSFKNKHTGEVNTRLWKMCIVAGVSSGLTLKQSSENVMLVNGKFSIWGDALKALCENHESFYGMSQRVDYSNKANPVAICIVKRKLKNGGITEVECRFSLDDAKTAELYSTNKNNVWKKYPIRMIENRARTNALRDAFSDVIAGLFPREEAIDFPSDCQTTPRPVLDLIESERPSVNNDEIDTDDIRALIDTINSYLLNDFPEEALSFINEPAQQDTLTYLWHNQRDRGKELFDLCKKVKTIVKQRNEG